MLSKDDHPTLKLEVWDYDRVGPHDPMGVATVNLHDFLLTRGKLIELGEYNYMANRLTFR